ncbi:MAG: ATP-binding cassette domain-containing protein [Gemmataceae bacterium]
MAAGEIVLLTGPSGSGKTTLLTLIGALRHVREGQLSVLSHPLHQASAAELMLVRRQIGFIFQQHNLLPFMLLAAMSSWMFDLHPEIPKSAVRQRATDLLESVGWAIASEYHPDRACPAVRNSESPSLALWPQNKLLLADEPTAALDSQSGRDVVNLLRNLAPHPWLLDPDGHAR